MSDRRPEGSRSSGAGPVGPTAISGATGRPRPVRGQRPGSTHCSSMVGNGRMLSRMEQDLHATVAGHLRRYDQRYTSGRRALVETLAAAGRPATIVEGLAGGTVPAQSTAYRDLSGLVQAGVVRKVFGGDDLTRYELAE